MEHPLSKFGGECALCFRLSTWGKAAPLAATRALQKTSILWQEALACRESLWHDLPKDPARREAEGNIAMLNWIIVAVATVIAAIFVGGLYQPVSVQGPNGTYLMVTNRLTGGTTVCVPQGCRDLGELPADTR